MLIPLGAWCIGDQRNDVCGAKRKCGDDANPRLHPLPLLLPTHLPAETTAYLLRPAPAELEGNTVGEEEAEEGGEILWKRHVNEERSTKSESGMGF